MTLYDYTFLPDGYFRLPVYLDGQPEIQMALLKLDYHLPHLNLISVKDLTTGVMFCTDALDIGKDIQASYYILLRVTAADFWD